MKSTKMKIGIKGDPTSFKEVNDSWKESKGKFKFFQGSNNIKIEDKDPELRPARLISRLKHNTTLSYNGIGMVIAPHSRTKINDYEKLGPIPEGIFLVPLPLKK